MKRTKTRKLVLTDGTWYYENTTCKNSQWCNDPKKAWNFYADGAFFSNLNTKKRLQWCIDTWTKHDPEIRVNKHGTTWYEKAPDGFDREKCKLKWVTIIETIKEEDFNFEGFTDK